MISSTERLGEIRVPIIKQAMYAMLTAGCTRPSAGQLLPYTQDFGAGSSATTAQELMVLSLEALTLHRLLLPLLQYHCYLHCNIAIVA